MVGRCKDKEEEDGRGRRDGGAGWGGRDQAGCVLCSGTLIKGYNDDCRPTGEFLQEQQSRETDQSQRTRGTGEEGD